GLSKPGVARRHVPAPEDGSAESGCGQHLLSEEIGEQDGLIALRAVAAQPDRAAKQSAVRAATLADVALATVTALVDSVRHQGPATLEVVAKIGEVHTRRGRSMAKTKSALLARVGTIPGTRRRQWCTADWAASRTVTR